MSNGNPSTHSDTLDCVNSDPLSNRAHVHSEASLQAIVNRLSRAEGHMRGIQEMVRENRSCPDVLLQIAAVRGAINRVARIIVDEHLSHCLHQAADDGEIETEITALKAALKKFLG